jgi:feruloyl esterase
MITNLALMLFSTALAATPCAGLKSISIPNTTITMAELVPAGVFTPPTAPAAAPAAPAAPAAGAPQRGGGGRGQGPGGGAPPPAIITVPAFCRVAATLKPTSDSSIDMEVWLPETWNGKFEFVGGGGWAGVISYPALATALQEGYATASTDTGHKGGNANFAIGHPEKVVDFAYRAVHESTVKAKTIMTTFYDRGPRLSYWNGCSTGGRQGLMEAQRYPEDFDAIVAGAPANYQTHLHAWDLGVAVPVLNNPASAVSTAKVTALSKAVVAACDAKDGVKDGLLNDPRTCKVSGKDLDFDLTTLLCKAGDGESCLTAPQLEAVKRMYAPAKTKSGEFVFPGKEPGSETGWNVIAASQAPPGVSLGSFQVAYDDLKWDWKSY